MRVILAFLSSWTNWIWLIEDLLASWRHSTHSNSVRALVQVSIVSHLSDLFRLSGIRSQSWLWVAWSRDHEVRISWYGAITRASAKYLQRALTSQIGMIEAALKLKASNLFGIGSKVLICLQLKLGHGKSPWWFFWCWATWVWIDNANKWRNWCYLLSE